MRTKGSTGSRWDFIPAQLRHKPYTGIDRAPGTILSNRQSELFRDNTAEFIFTDKFGESSYPAAEGTDPFTPEQHALDIIDPVRLHMARQEFVQEPEFVDLFLVNVDSGFQEQFAKPVQHLEVCLVHDGRGKAVSGTCGPAPGPGDLFLSAGS
jgi:hypothetical protein